MSMLSKSIFSAFLGTILLASCSRPVAYFQPTAREHFATTQTKTAAAPVATETVVVTEEAAPVAAPAEQVAQAQKAVDQLEAYVSSDSKLASNKKVAKHMARLNEMMATASTKATVSNETSAKKMSFIQRTMLKKMNNKIKAKMSPDQTKASSNTRLGLIIGVIGLIFVLVGAIAGVGALTLIGLLAVVIGLVLLLLGLANA